MFRDNELPCVTSWQQLEESSADWLAHHILDKSYVDWLMEEGGVVVAREGVWFMEWPPHYLKAEAMRGYLMNFYVSPAVRGRGLAKKMVEIAVAECRKRNVQVAVLHASKMGRPVYASLGWQPGSEMMLSL